MKGWICPTFIKRALYFLMLSCLCVLFCAFADKTVAGDREGEAISKEIKKEAKVEKETTKFKLPEMVVTATRTETSQEETTKSVSVITAQDMKEQQETFLPELMGEEPGVYFRQLGGLGQWSSITIRGASDRNTLFQYNGLPLRDAADTQNTLNYFIEDIFGTSSLDRIEILKGTNSTLHGSQAMGGVINIVPKKWQKGFSAELRNEVGPNNTYIGGSRVSYGQDRFYFDVNPMYLTTDGEKYGGNEGFYYRNKGLTAGAGIKPLGNASLEFSALVFDSKLALGNTPIFNTATGKPNKQQADPNQYREGLLYQLGLSWNHEVTSLWDYSVRGSYGETERHYFHLNSTNPNDQSNYDGHTTYLDMQHNLHPFDWLTFNVGADYGKDVFIGQEPSSPFTGDFSPVRFTEAWTTWDLFAQTQLAFLDRSLLFTAGGRYNAPQAFGHKTVWEVSGAYIIKSTHTKLHAHLGTGYRTPSLYETYGGYVWGGKLVSIGNKDLVPEESIGYEFGVDQSFLNDKVKVGATYFNTRFRHWIGFDSLAFQYKNANRTELSGVESYVNIRPFSWVKVKLAYTYTDTRAEEADGDWTRGSYQPHNKLNIVTTFYPTDKLTLACNVAYLDSKIVPLNDAAWNQVQWKEPSKWVADLSGTYKVSRFLDLFMRVKNLLNKNYTESGYQMPGRSIYGGVKLSY
jgi:vitamin B12 transporter